MNWYVLQVITGMEQEVAETIQKSGIHACAPVENRLIRTRGRWIEREYLLFPGYLFVELDYTVDTWHQLTAIPGVIRILGAETGSPVPLIEWEAEWVSFLGRCLLKPSHIKADGNGGYRVTSGALLRLQDRIVRFCPRRRRAIVRLTFAGQTLHIPFSAYFYEAEASQGQSSFAG